MTNMTGVDDLSQRRSGARWRWIAALLLIAAGGAAGVWATLRFAVPDAPAIMATARPATVAAAPVAVAVTPYAAVTPAEAGTMAARMALLEERLGRITLTANAAAGNAGKAEALLVALAARRAVERGRSLGTMELQLERLFGDTQPLAVASIISAARMPISQGQLIARLETLQPRLLANSDGGLFDRIGRGLSALVTVRASNGTAGRPERRLARARAALLADDLPAAITEVEAMPGARNAAVLTWLNIARRRNDAARALDLVEAAAIVGPANTAPVTAPAPPAR
jgi:hypothetical protein